jgi:hypothetical protein
MGVFPFVSLFLPKYNVPGNHSHFLFFPTPAGVGAPAAVR